MAEIPLKRRKSSIQPTNQPVHSIRRPCIMYGRNRFHFIHKSKNCSFLTFESNGKYVWRWEQRLLDVLLLVHLSRRLKCTIVITRYPSSICPSSVRPSLTFHIFDFSSETAEQNSTKLDVLYQVLCFSGRSEKQDCRPGLWLAETFLTSPLKPLNGIQRNLSGNKISTSSSKFVFFGLIGKTRWPPWPLIGWDIFDFSSETAERNSTKLKQEARSQRPLPSLCISGQSEKQNGRPGLWLAETFSTSPLKPLSRIERILTNVLYQVCVFRAD